ncbi:DNA polymerase III subunit delta [Sorangium sp. So ce233]|uniref:DNA polymerase III subunit delta n=1 Tax=Sorangium sp. So ce233 TaxID=3133290 RepID=UPI003F61C9B3
MKEATTGALRPVYLVLGEERWLVDRVVSAIREAAAKGGIAGFNEDKFTAGDAPIESILGAARMLPMMGPRRFVLVRGVDRWEKKDDSDDGDGEEERGGAGGKRGVSKQLSPLDALAEYAKAPSPSAVLVLVAPKLHGQRRLVTTAKKGDFLVACEPLNRRALPGFITSMARDKGNPIASDVAEQLAELAGPELGYVVDAIERLSLYVGPKQPITEDAIAQVVIRVRQSTVWELIDALGRRRLDRALAALADAYDPRDGGLRLLGAVSWSVRQMVKFESALAAGASQAEAAQRAGVAPFKANDVAQSIRHLPKGALAGWMRMLAETDLALKSSRRPAQAVLETMLIEMCSR